METYGRYYKLLDQIRIGKNMSIHELCDDIISERTYLRQMKNGSKINLTTFNKLLNRLDVRLGQFMTFMIHFDQKDTGVNRFIMRVHHSQFMDIEPIYQNVLNYQSENFIESWILKVYIALYQFKSGQSSIESFKATLVQLLGQIDPNDKNNMIIDHVKLIYHIFFPEEQTLDMKQFAEKLVNYHSTLSLIYYVLTLDIYLWFTSEHFSIPLETYEKLINVFTYYVQFFQTKSFESTLEIYHASLCHVKGEFKLRDQYLARGLLNASVIQSDLGFSLYKEKVFSAFQINPEEFIDKKLDELKKHPRIEWME